MRINEMIHGFHFDIRYDILERWCNDYGYKTIEDFRNKSNKEKAYIIYCNSYFQRSW